MKIQLKIHYSTKNDYLSFSENIGNLMIKEIRTYRNNKWLH